MAKLTLIGLNNYTDGHLWDGLSCPTGIDKTTFINTIMLNYGEMETLYADPDMMKFAIKTWSDRNSWSMLKAVTAINVQYEPLSNYDRHETRTTEGSSSGSNTGSHSRSTGSTTTTESSEESSTSATIDRDETNETEHKVSAYDSSTYSPDNTDDGSSTYDEESSISGTSEAESTSTIQGTDTGTDNLQHADEHEETETIRAWGNIGVTTSQQMLQSELDLSLYNMYSTFAGLFAYDLLVMTY